LLRETDVPNQKDICYLKLPYIDPIVEDFSDKLKKLVHFNYAISILLNGKVTWLHSTENFFVKYFIYLKNKIISII